MAVPSKTLAFGVAAFVAAFFPGAAALAAGGYGPASPTGPTDAPGGFTTISEVTTVTASGASLNTPVAGASVDVQAPAGAFTTPVQVEVTTPAITQVSAALPQLGFAGYSGVAGLGLKVLDGNGQPVTGTFAKPLSITLVGAALGKPGEKVVEIDGPNAAHTLTSTLGQGSITFSIDADPDLVVVNPVAAATAPSGATTVHTGKPLTGEADLAIVLVAAGAGLAVFSLRGRWRVAAR